MGEKIYRCNENYFEIINTEDKAYWLGFLYADGCVTKTKDYIILDLSVMDYKHLLLFKEAINSNHKIYFHQDKKGHEYNRLQIRSEKMANDLVNKGCMPAKTFILTFPTEEQVPKELLCHFIRGYFDGDGCIYSKLKRRKNRVNLFLETEFNVLGTELFLKELSKHLPINNISVSKKWGDNIYEIRIYNKKSILQLMSYLYDGYSTFLQRKYEKFLLIQDYVNKSSYNYKAS